ncbi:unnamed protein product [Phytophthora fragariaefolia]|uniref:Unnamed protein product n=1 Tax=Phytophthora fragariaefolia TaxID=1490495 RepID=A0A9W6Y763_9STRA|nr:unnamed protein product [Phytophthora fragariaefolia]
MVTQTEGIGTVKIVSDVEDKDVELFVDGVLYVPGATHGRFSVGLALEQGFEVDYDQTTRVYSVYKDETLVFEAHPAQAIWIFETVPGIKNSGETEYFLEYGGLAQTQVQPLQVLSNLAVSIGGEVGTWAPPVDNLRDRTLRDAWTDYDGILESLPVGVTNFDDRLQAPNCDYDEDMGSTFTAGGNGSSVSGADYDSRGNLQNGFVALLLSDNSDGDGVCGDYDEARSNGDGVRDDGDGVRGDGDGVCGAGDGVRGHGDGVRGDDRDVHRDTAGDVEHGYRELSDDAQNLGDGEHEVLVGGGDGEHGDDEHDEAEQDDEGHEDDPSTVDGRLSLELEQLIVEAAEKMLRQTPRNSIDAWVFEISGCDDPDGIIVHMFGPAQGRAHALTLLEDPDLENINGRDRRFHGYLLYGDPAFGQTDVFASPFDKVGATREEIEVNRSLSKVRIAVEWMFGKIIGEWAMMDFKRKMSIGNVPAGMLYEVAIFANCVTIACHQNIILI